MPSISPTGWCSPPSPLFFRVVAHAVRCHVFSHFALERMRGGMVRGGWIQEGECEEKTETTVFFLLSKPARGQGLFFSSSRGSVRKSSTNCLGCTKQGCVCASVHCPSASFIHSELSRHDRVGAACC